MSPHAKIHHAPSSAQDSTLREARFHALAAQAYLLAYGDDDLARLANCLLYAVESQLPDGPITFEQPSRERAIRKLRKLSAVADCPPDTSLLALELAQMLEGAR